MKTISNSTQKKAAKPAKNDLDKRASMAESSQADQPDYKLLEQTAEHEHEQALYNMTPDELEEAIDNLKCDLGEARVDYTIKATEGTASEIDEQAMDQIKSEIRTYEERLAKLKSK